MAEGGQENPVSVAGTNVAGKNFLSVVTLIIDLGGFVLRRVLQKIAGDREKDITFSQYLDNPSVRCELFHLWKIPDCCVCNCRCKNKLKDDQWERLYHQTGGNFPKKCKEKLDHRQNHCCLYIALTEVLSNLDVSLMCLMILKLEDCRSNKNLQCYTKNIRQIRNDIFHAPSSTMSDEEYENIWADTIRNFREMARFIGNSSVLSDMKKIIEKIEEKFNTSEANSVVNTFKENTKKIKRCENTIGNGNFVDIEQLNLETDAQETTNESIKSIIEGLEKPSNLPAVKEKISLIPNDHPKKKNIYEKVSQMQNVKENIEKKLENLAEIVRKNAIKDLEKIAHKDASKDSLEYLKTVLGEIDALAENTEEESDEDTSRRKAHHYMLISKRLKERRVVWALEFGDTYTSCVFSLNASEDPSECIYHPGLQSKKTATALLLDKRNSDNSYFGYEAEEEYARLVEGGRKEEHYHYFKSFPTVLRSCLKLGRKTPIIDEAGKSFEDAQLIFTVSIKNFVQMLLHDMISDATMDDVNFVITIPATSGDTVSKFVIDAAVEAGIKEDHVTTVSEAVAASVYCQRRDSYNTEKECFQPREGDTYLVADLGGESSKFTVHVKAERGDLDRIVSVKVCPWGGNSINEKFFTILEDSLGENILDLLKTKYAESYIKFLRQFENEKRKFGFGSGKIELIYPQQLDVVYKEKYKKSIFEVFSDQECEGQSITVSGQKLAMEGGKFRKLFHPTLYHLKKYMKEELRKGENKAIRGILLVGGFSQCKMVQEGIVGHTKLEFPKHRVFIPKEPELAIIKGAVFCGRLPYTLRGDIHQYTFGEQIWPKVNPEKHPEEKKVMVEGTARCKGGLSTFAHKGQRVKVGESCTKFFIGLEPDADILVCEIYASDKPNPQFTSECISQGTIEIKLPNIKPENLIMEESFHFGETEMYVTARDIYLKQYDVKCSHQMKIQEKRGRKQIDM